MNGIKSTKLGEGTAVRSRAGRTPSSRSGEGVVDVDRMRRILHVDMDAFYASVEQRDDPELRGRPVIVGGRPNGRGVVAACSYEARAFGVHSAMPSAEAARRCPDAVFVRGRFAVYQAISAEVRDVFAGFTDRIEPLSLDEAYLDVTDRVGSSSMGAAVSIAREIRRRIRERTGLVASAGVSYNKFLAKIASDHDKPDGLFVVAPEDGERFVASLPVGRIHGVGQVTESAMADVGITTGADLRRWSFDELEARFGRRAGYYYRLARGIDDRPVRASRTRKSRGSERTFSTNLTDPHAMRTFLLETVETLLQELAERDLVGRTLTIKVRFPNFDTPTRSYSTARGSIDRACARRIVPRLLERALAGRDRVEVRLLGASISGLAARSVSEPCQLELDGLDR